MAWPNLTWMDFIVERCRRGYSGSTQVANTHFTNTRFMRYINWFNRAIRTLTPTLGTSLMKKPLLVAPILAFILCLPFKAHGQTSDPAASAPASPSLQTQDGYKSPGIATVVSVFIPGGGSMYADRIPKGVTI